MSAARAQKESTTRRYDANYGNFQRELYAEIRKEAYGEDIGQNSWLTASEHDEFLQWMDLSPETRLLDVACGAGGPALRTAAKCGCLVTGIDLHEQAIAAANSLAAERNLEQRAQFRMANAGEPLPFPDASFDAITCIDAINHIPDRRNTLLEWARLLKAGGELLFTDPTTMTGPLTADEIKIRSMSGFYLFVPEGFDERFLGECGFRLLKRENVTRNMAELAERRWKAREARKSALEEIEGKQGFAEQQEFLAIAAKIANENRLSRFAFLAEKNS
ncbi:MAG TPA: class I SAM-dependent methyltransferase [Candidatus Acidoferrum sp.]|nr:class I SAM-dependent methyltransferase [Candidatus Acidoferrum sp.]